MKIFTLRLPLLLAFMLTATLAMAQTATTYTTVGIIGDATANGWNASTPMTASATNPHMWTITIPLTTASVKFRANDAWDVNWGSSAFPSGTGTQNGDNIPVTVGTYKVTFDDTTGNYNFTTGALATVSAATLAPLTLTLAPNPAKEALNLAYDLPTATTISIKVFNSLGQIVRQLTPVRQTAGRQGQPLSITGLAAGVYLVQLQTETQKMTTRLVVE